MPIPLLMAGMRDASWFRKPGRAGRYHIEDRGSPACGVLSPPGLVDLMEAADVPLVLRCGRRACAKWWPTEGTD